MHRTQISLEERQYQSLMHEAYRVHTSLSALIRRLIDDYLQTQKPIDNPIAALTGIAEGTGEAVGRNHDQILYGKSR